MLIWIVGFAAGVLCAAATAAIMRKHKARRAEKTAGAEEETGQGTEKKEREEKEKRDREIVLMLEGISEVLGYQPGKR